MEEIKKNTIAVLKDLLRICKDEQSLFQTAADKSTDLKLKHLLAKYSDEKKEYALKLKSEIKRLGENPEFQETKPDSFSNVPQEEINYSQKELLQQCLNFDDNSIKRYSNAVNEDILWEVIPLVAKQYFGALNLHDQLTAFIKPVQNKTLPGVTQILFEQRA